ncbi:MAG TPA: hypothetical protein VFA46_07330 [Actinomycetes bacterium]|jgi:hypothetical protein|nr:hypothetical protein [Actinomycetes bacterium]
MTDDSTWITIVVRAWADVGGVRIRLLRADSAGGRDHRAVTSIDEAAATVTTWLHTLDGNRVTETAEQRGSARRDAGTAQQQQAATTNQRRTERRGTDAAGDDDADDERRRS